MTRVLALDWDRSEVRCVLAEGDRRGLKVHWATSMALPDLAEPGQPSSDDISGALRAALAGQRAGRATTIVGLDRASVETFSLSLPPATDGELPMLVQHQVSREASALGEGDTIDFVAIGGNPAEARTVMAAVLNAQRQQSILGICAGAGLHPSRLVLRPLGSASLFLKQGMPEQACLLVNLLAEEVDLVVVEDGRAVFLRTVRLPTGSGLEQASQRLAAEISRTLVVAQQAAATRSPVDQVYVFGGPGEHQDLLERLRGDLSVSVTELDPFEGADVSAVELPGNAGRFASLLGMVLDESQGRHAIDFLHPKRPAPPPDRRRTVLIAAAVVALLLAGGSYAYWSAYSGLAERNRALVAERKELEEAAKRSRSVTQLAGALQNWSDSEVVWLDELRDLSLRLPPGRDLLVQRMTISGGRSGGSVIDLQGVVREAGVIARLDRTLHDDFHAVISRRVGDNSRSDGYSWLFERTIAVSPRDKTLYHPLAEAGP